jgi:hypothetical protein
MVRAAGSRQGKPVIQKYASVSLQYEFWNNRIENSLPFSK